MYDKTVIALLFSSVILYDDYMKNKNLNITITEKIGNFGKPCFYRFFI